MGDKNNEGMDNGIEDATMTNNGTGDNIGEVGETGSAEGRTSEDTLSEYKSLIASMKAQNDALMKQNESLQAQFGILIRNGASAGSVATTDDASEDGNEPYVSLSQLGNELGKRDYQSHNLKDGD